MGNRDPAGLGLINRQFLVDKFVSTPDAFLMIRRFGEIQMAQ